MEVIGIFPYSKKVAKHLTRAVSRIRTERCSLNPCKKARTAVAIIEFIVTFKISQFAEQKLLHIKSWKHSSILQNQKLCIAI